MPETATRLFADSLRSRLQGNLDRFERHPLEGGEHRAAVALVVLPNEDGEASIILTQRAFHLPRHGGQWALPGGRIDAGEGAEAAARRELEEEVGIPLGEGSFLGILDDYSTRSGWVVSPVVLWGKSRVRELLPDPREVASAHRVPLRELLLPQAKVERKMSGHEGPLLSLRLLGTEIFCPTAAMVYQFIEVCLRGKSVRVDRFEQPRFAWR